MPDEDRLFAEVIAGSEQIVFVAVANCDNRLGQYEWASMCWALHSELEHWITAELASDPLSPHQNACWRLRFPSAQEAGAAKALAASIGARFRHELIWTPAALTEVI